MKKIIPQLFSQLSKFRSVSETENCVYVPELWVSIAEMAWKMPGLRLLEQHVRGGASFTATHGKY